VYVISRHDLARISSLNPEFQPLLEEMTARYPTDEQLLATWKHDRAWGQYKSKLASQLSPRAAVKAGGASPRRIDVAARTRGVVSESLPPFVAPPQSAASRPQGLDRDSKLYQWFGTYIDEHVLPDLTDLLANDPKPAPPPSPAQQKGGMDLKSRVTLGGVASTLEPAEASPAPATSAA